MLKREKPKKEEKNRGTKKRKAPAAAAAATGPIGAIPNHLEFSKAFLSAPDLHYRCLCLKTMNSVSHRLY